MKSTNRRNVRSKEPSSEGLYFFTILAHPKPAAKVPSNVQGAYVNCWINFRLQDGALLLAKFYIRQNGWEVRSIKEHRWINGDDDVQPDMRDYLHEAQKDGTSFVYHIYPKR